MYTSSPACPYLMCECFLHQSCYQTDFNKSLLLSSFYSNKLNIWDHKHNINFICGSLCRQSGCWWLFSEGLFLIVSSHLPLVWNLCQMLQPEKPACQPLVSCLTLLSASNTYSFTNCYHHTLSRFPQYWLLGNLDHSCPLTLSFRFWVCPCKHLYWHGKYHTILRAAPFLPSSIFMETATLAIEWPSISTMLSSPSL